MGKYELPPRPEWRIYTKCDCDLATRHEALKKKVEEIEKKLNKTISILRVT